MKISIMAAIHKEVLESISTLCQRPPASSMTLLQERIDNKITLMLQSFLDDFSPHIKDTKWFKTIACKAFNCLECYCWHDSLIRKNCAASCHGIWSGILFGEYYLFSCSLRVKMMSSWMLLSARCLLPETEDEDSRIFLQSCIDHYHCLSPLDPNGTGASGQFLVADAYPFWAAS